MAVTSYWTSWAVNNQNTLAVVPVTTGSTATAGSFSIGATAVVACGTTSATNQSMAAFPTAGRGFIDTSPITGIQYGGVTTSTGFTTVTCAGGTSQAYTTSNKVYGLDKRFDWLNDPIWVALFTGTVPTHGGTADNQDAWVMRSDTGALTEASGTGYTAGGVVLGTKTIVYDNTTGGTMQLKAANSTWTTATIAPTYAIIYCQRGTYSTWTTGGTQDPILGIVDFGGAQSVVGANFTIQWDTTGVLKYVIS